jgi:hypothetical protein
VGEHDGFWQCGWWWHTPVNRGGLSQLRGEAGSGAHHPVWRWVGGEAAVVCAGAEGDEQGGVLGSCCAAATGKAWFGSWQSCGPLARCIEML